MPNASVTAALSAATVLVVVCAPLGDACAQEAVEIAGWTGEASVSASASSGNTEATDLGAGFKLARETGMWTNKLGLVLDYGDTAGVETKNRVFGDYQLDRQLSERSYAFGRATYEVDEFSGYESRRFVGLGYGRDVIVTDATTWSVQGGPGFNWDEERAEFAADGVTLVTPAITTEEVALALGSRYAHAFNAAVSLTNDSDITSSSETTTLFNSFALTAALMDTLAARFSVDVTHNTTPPHAAEATDTITRASLVYTFGN